jgi:hypothetical protein
MVVTWANLLQAGRVKTPSSLAATTSLPTLADADADADAS